MERLWLAGPWCSRTPSPAGAGWCGSWWHPSVCEMGVWSCKMVLSLLQYSTTDKKIQQHIHFGLNEIHSISGTTWYFQRCKEKLSVARKPTGWRVNTELISVSEIILKEVLHPGWQLQQWSNPVPTSWQVIWLRDKHKLPSSCLRAGKQWFFSVNLFWFGWVRKERFPAFTFHSGWKRKKDL